MPAHFLVVDDEEDLGFLLKSRFKERIRGGEWVFHMARDGMEALDVLEREPEIELVLTDLNMPRMGGLDLLERLQKMDRLIRAIVVSAYSDMDNIRTAMNRGAFDFIVKPINLVDLEATLLKTLDHIEFLREAARIRKQLVETKDALDLSKELAEIKSQFFANVSHEFRTPLTLILGPLQDILHGDLGELSEKMQAHLSIMQQHAGRLKQLIDQLLDVARLEAGKLALNIEEIDFVQFTTNLVQSYYPAAELARVTLQCRHSVDALRIQLDPDHYEKILSNLLSNALKWTPKGGYVRVLTGRESDMVFVQVRDNGKGIPPDAVPYIFDRFYQIGAPAGGHRGTGIGLALTKELVSMHGGRVTVESEPGFGSTFTVYLPLGGKKLDEAVRDAGRPSEKVIFDAMTAGESFEDEEIEEGGRLPVLLAEDNPDVRAYIRGVLNPYYRVIEAEDGRQALAMVESESPALVISDVMMPEMDGFELCENIKKDALFGHIPVILLTARAENESRLAGLELGADDYIVKPFNAHELLVRAENLIAIRQMLRDKFTPGYILRASDISVPSVDEAFLEAVQAEIEKQMGDPNFDVARLADAVALSPRQLRRRVRELTGLSTSGLVRSLRLQRAAQLLKQQAGTVSEIAYQVGFQQVKYFSRLFKQVYGTTPSEF